MLKMKVDPEICMKTKDHATICPTQKTTFVPGCMPFYTETHVFCRNRSLFCHYSHAGERILRFKMDKPEPAGSAKLGCTALAPISWM
jgi:hypothetical protein